MDDIDASLMREAGLNQSFLKAAFACYSISKQILYVRMGAVGDTGAKSANRTLFTTQDVFTLDAAYWHLSQGFGLKDLEAATRGGSHRHAVTDDDCLTVDAQTTDSVHLTIVPAQERVVAPPPREDPLALYSLLKESATESYILTASTLARVLGVSNSTLHGWNSREERLGFSLERSGIGKWVVRGPSGEAGPLTANSSSTATPLANF